MLCYSTRALDVLQHTEAYSTTSMYEALLQHRLILAVDTKCAHFVGCGNEDVVQKDAILMFMCPTSMHAMLLQHKCMLYEQCVGNVHALCNATCVVPTKQPLQRACSKYDDTKRCVS